MRQTKRDLIDLLRKDKIICERFAVHKKIGQGSFGEIFEVTNLEKGRSAALKVVRSQNLKSELTVDNEIRALNALQGLDGIPKLYSSGEWNNGAYIEMELLDKDLGSSENFKL